MTKIKIKNCYVGVNNLSRLISFGSTSGNGGDNDNENDDSGNASGENPPASPTNLRLDSATYNSITIKWDYQAGLTGYILQYKRSTLSNWTTASAPIASTSSATISGLLPSASYNVRLQAINSTGISAATLLTASTSNTEASQEDPYIVINTGDDGVFAVVFFATNTNLTIDWGDGSQEQVNNIAVNTTKTHFYSNYNVEKKITFIGTSSSEESPLGQQEDYPQQIWREKVVKVGGNWDRLGIDSYWNYLFYNCTNLMAIESDLFATRTSIVKTITTTNNSIDTKKEYFKSIFQNCTSLETIPENFLASLTNISSTSNIIGKNNITSANNGSPVTATNNMLFFNQCFQNCTSLEAIPENFLANLTNISNSCNNHSYSENYSHNSSPVTATNNISFFNQCFQNCTSLEAIS
ncbi:MAG: fibronectin type III domain-containing protein, partial [Planctomycetaceae bacterium]|nr:fibronectin type III domain-containing protein [Planctomycetaceae bacterium]